MESKKNRKIIILFLLETIVLLIVYLYHINYLYAMVMSEDELGYWGNAAYFAGLDWGNVLNNTVYYSYGYSFILMIILKLPVSPLIMYRLAIILNALFMVVSFGISNYLFRRLFLDKNEYLINIACFAGTLYSGYITISNFAFSECLLIMLTWALLLQVFLICKRKKPIRIIVFCLELCYIYVVHMRTLAYVIAGVIFLFLIFINDVKKAKHFYRKKVLEFGFECIIIFLFIFISSLFKKHLQAELYVSDNISNDYGAIIKSVSLHNIFIPFISTMCGRALYLWVSSLGFLPIGFVYTCIKYNIYKIENSILKYFYAFALLIFLGEFVLSSFAQRTAGIGPVYRLDILIYGRYIEIAIPFLLIVGLIHFPDIIGNKKEVLYVLISFVVFWFLSYLLNSRVEKYDLTKITSYQGACAAGVFWLYIRNGFLPYLFYQVVVLTQSIFLILVAKKNLGIYLVEILFVIAYWITNAYAVLENQTIPYQERYCYALTEKNAFFEEINLNNYEVGFVSGVEYSTRGNIQFYLKDIPLICINEDFNSSKLVNLPDIMVVEYRGEVENIDKQIERLLENNIYYFADEIGVYRVYVHAGVSLNSL